MIELAHLFQPIEIGGMALKNRIVMSPMTTSYGSYEQEPTQRLIDYYAARAAGGVGLITLEVCTIDPLHRYHPQSMTLGDDRFIASHEQLVAAIHKHGAKCQPQITHPGPESLAPFFGDGPSVGASPTVSASTGQLCSELRVEEIERIVEQYGDAARRAQQAGYDGMELHAAHGYMLMASFLSPLRNRRTDDYNGFTLAGRTRFLIEVIRRMKQKTGGKMPLTLGISGFERAAGGRDVNDTQQMAGLLVQAGVDAFRVSGGVMDRLSTQVVPAAKAGMGINLGVAQALKQVVDVPIIAVGGMHDPVLADQWIGDGKMDLIAMGRPFLADPDWPKKVANGRAQDVRRCITCQTCIDSLMPGASSDGLLCAVNAQTGREGEFALSAAAVLKRVVVVGGGPGGMESARVAAKRGHRVTLYERDELLGGTLRQAALLNKNSAPLLNFLTEQMRQLLIDIKLGAAIDAERIIAEQPDAVVIASGGDYAVPVLPGADLPIVIAGSKLRDLIEHLAFDSDGHNTVLGKKVAIIGADLTALQLAASIAGRGHQVYLLHDGADLGADIGPKRRMEHMLRLDECGVVINTGITIESICAAGVAIHTGFASRVLETDNVIITGHKQPVARLYDALQGRVPEVHRVGDCATVGLIVDAIAQGMRVACEL